MTSQGRADGREQTDRSLRTERTKTDVELRRRDKQLETDADAAVETARDNADTRVRTARDLADASVAATAAVQADRVREDAALADERAAVDLRISNERIERHRLIAQLLADERAATDESLASERRASDAAIGARDDFLGMVSHDVRSLLAAIDAQAAIIEEGAARQPQTAPFAKRATSIQRFVTQMTRLVGDLTDYVSIEAGRLGVHVEPHDASHLVRETLEVFQGPAAARGISLSARVADDVLLATFDHERILQVLGNLVANAIRFNEEGGTVDVEVRANDEEVVFSVCDSGIGIPPDVLPHIFERFHQATTNDRRGLGLGLYIARCIVEAHGGRISASSTVGEGSVFTFTLPRAR
jgi:signal transduction histidine kinase